MKKRLLVVFPLAAVSCFLTCFVNEKDTTMVSRISNASDIKNVFPSTVGEIKEKSEFAKRTVLAQLNAIVNADEKSWISVGDSLDRIVDLIYPTAAALEVLMYTHPEAEIRQAAQAAVVDITQFLVEHVELNKELYDVFKEYASDVAPKEDLSDEKKYFVKETLKDFERSGLGLPEDKVLKVKQMLKDLANLSQQFEVNIATDNRTVLVEEEELKGLPENFIKNLKKDGQLFVLGMDTPTYTAVMEDCAVATTRKKMSKAYSNRAYPANVQVLQDVLNKRDKLAKDIGYSSYAHAALDKLMAGNPEVAYKFLHELFEKAEPKAQKEFKEWVQELPESVVLTDDGKLHPWDMAYLKAQYKKKHLVDENELKQYFPMENTVKQLLSIYEKFFNLEFKFSDTKDLWHQDIQLIEVLQDGKTLGYILLDLYPRDNKYTHACHCTVIHSVKRHGMDSPALSVLIANFPKSTEDEPSLLKFWDVRTFFHEFGHAIHALLGRTEQFSFSGTSVKRDFVEMPSQMLENWLQDKEILKMVSKHYQTGKSLSDNQIDKIVQLVKFDSGNFITRQVGLALLSLDYHAEGKNKDLDAIATKISNVVAPQVERDDENHFWASFGHLTGYSAGYYGYLWSDVFSKDLFEHIAEEGLLSPEAGKKYSEAILAPGGSKEPSLLLVEYLGRKPSQKAYLKTMGLEG
jgi:thimet oligopeptidase